MRIVLFALLIFNSVYSFDTLTQATKYAVSFNEYPEPDNDNWLDPDFSSFHKSQIPGFIGTFLRKIGFTFFAPPSLSMVAKLKKLLVSITQKREESGKKGDFVDNITTKPEDQFVIWGDVQGAFHSLLRDLAQLKQLKIIDDNFKIIKEGVRFVFMGDVIDRSPFILETLTLVLCLMSANSLEKVFYIRGNHETDSHWHNFGTKRELEIEAREVSNEEIPLNTELNRFFNTLPSAVYIGDGKKIVRISQFSSHEYKKLREWDKGLDLKAVIKALSRSATFAKLDGLRLLEPELGATAWTILSCPTMTYQKIYEFFNDAFVILDCNEDINRWILTLYRRDVREKSNAFKTTQYNLISGREANNEKKFTKEIVIGSILDFSKASAATGERLRSGLALRINKSNVEAELGDKIIRLFMFDDEYTPHIAHKQANYLIDNLKSDIVLQTLGTPTHEALLQLIQDKKLLALFNFGGSSLFRKPDLLYNIFYRTSYKNEAKALVEYAVKNIFAKSFAILFQDDSFGYALRDGARETLKSLGIEKWAEASYARNTLNTDEIVKKITEVDPEVIFCFGTRTLFEALVRKMGAPYFSQKKLLCPSFITDVFRSFLRSRGMDCVIARVVPDFNSDIEIAKEYCDAMERYNPGGQLSVDSFEAYINASLFIEALKKTSGDVTKEKLIEVFHAMKDYEFKGLHINYDSQTQELSKYKDVWVDDGKEWIYLPAVRK